MEADDLPSQTDHQRHLPPSTLEPGNISLHDARGSASTGAMHSLLSAPNRTSQDAFTPDLSASWPAGRGDRSDRRGRKHTGCPLMGWRRVDVGSSFAARAQRPWEVREQERRDASTCCWWKYYVVEGRNGSQLNLSLPESPASVRQSRFRQKEVPLLLNVVSVAQRERHPVRVESYATSGSRPLKSRAA